MLQKSISSKIGIFIFLLIPLFCYQFFQYRALPLVFLKMSGFLSSFALFILTLPQFFGTSAKRGSIQYYVKIIITLTLLSFLMALVYWNQPIPNTFRSSIAYFNLSFYFLLLKYKIKKDTLLQLIYVYTIVVILLWFYAIGQAPHIVFGHLGEDDFTELSNNRGGYRIRILGTTISIICYFYFITKAFLYRKKWMYCIASLLFLFNCTDLTRSNIASIAIATIVLLWLLYRNKISYMVTVISVGFAASFILFYFFGENTELLIDLTKSQFETGSEDSGFYRLKEYSFFFTEFNKSVFTYIFGNGSANHSALQVYLDYQKAKGYWLSDVGYANIFCTIGLVGLLTYIFMIVKALRMETSKEALFAKAYIVYATLSTFTIGTLLDSIPLAICLYWIYVDSRTLRLTSKMHTI